MPVTLRLKRAGTWLSITASAYGVELTRRQNIQQGRAGDKAMITGAVGQESSQCLDAAVDDHRVVRQRQ